MCGRFALFASENDIIAHYRLSKGFSMRARYNIAPSQTIPVITHLGKQVEFFRWGFIPAWAKSKDTMDPTIPAGFINARWETLDEKPAFKKAFTAQRCLIPSNGFFEWRTISAKKQPYYIHLADQSLISFAGIWSVWRSPRSYRHCSPAMPGF